MTDAHRERWLGRLLADATLRRSMAQESFAMAVKDHDARRNCNAIFELMRGAAAAGSSAA